VEIGYARTGKERKALVAAISEALGAKAKYLGAPSFAYEVGGYTVGKDGTLRGRTNKKLVTALAAQGFTGSAGAPKPDGGEGKAQGDLVTIELPLEGYTPEALDNLAKMVAAKGALLKAALGTDDLPIQVTEDTIGFPWFVLGEPGEALYCAQFASALCKAAKAKKRVTAKERTTDNPRYAMRCWLLALGLIGDEYKAARKLLLSGLPGNSAFKNGKPDKEAKDGR
jgi:hypothetical protein